LPAVLLNLCCLLFCWAYAACCSAELMLPAVLLYLCCLLFCCTYAACCSAVLMLPAVLLNLCCLLFCWAYAACCSAVLMLPAVLLNLCCLLFSWTACCSAELMLPAVLLNLWCLLFCWTYAACCSAELMLPAEIMLHTAQNFLASKYFSLILLHCPRAQEFCVPSYSDWWRLWTSTVHRQKVITNKVNLIRVGWELFLKATPLIFFKGSKRSKAMMLIRILNTDPDPGGNFSTDPCGSGSTT